MRNVRVVSFADSLIEAGFQRIPPRKEVVLQYDLLFPYVMHYHKEELAIASIEKLAEHVGKKADKKFLEELFWLFPEEPAKGAPTVKAKPKVAPGPVKVQAPSVEVTADPQTIPGGIAIPTAVSVVGDSVTLAPATPIPESEIKDEKKEPVTPDNFNMPEVEVAKDGSMIEPKQRKKRK